MTRVPLLAALDQSYQFVGAPVALALSANVGERLTAAGPPNEADNVALLLAAVALALADEADDDAEPAALLA